MNNKLLIGLLLCIAFTQTTFAQEAIPGVRWQKTFGGSNFDGGGSTDVYDSLHRNSKSLLKTRDGGYIIGSKSFSSDGDALGNVSSGRIWIFKIDSTGNVQWKVYFGNISNWNMLGSIIEAVGGGYLMVGTARAGDDDLVNNPNADDVLVAKINDDGQVAWQHKYGGTGTDRGYSIVQNHNNGYLVTGYTESSDGDAISSSRGAGDLWLLNIDLSGNLVQERKFGGTSNDCGALIKPVRDGGFIIGGITSSGDGDVPASKGNNDIWLFKLDPVGSIEWSRVYGGSNSEVIHDLIEDMDGGYVFSGSTLSNNGDISGYHGNSDAWIVKLNHTGDIVWQQCIGGSSQDVGSAITVIPGPFYFLAGNNYSSDGNITGFKGFSDIFVSHINPEGTILWTKTFGGSGLEFPYAITTNADNDIIVLGETQSSDGDISANHGVTDLWLFKLGSVNTFYGRTFYDFNSNSIKDGSDVFADNVRINVERTGLKKSTISSGGSYTLDVDLGTYTISAISPSAYYNIVPATSSTNFETYFNTAIVDFALQPIPGKKDLGVTMFTINPVRPGFEASYYLTYQNSGTTTINAKLEFALNPMLIIKALSVPNTSIEEGKLIWELPMLTPGTSGTIIIKCTVNTPPSVNNGDTLKLVASILPSQDDINPVDNISKLNLIVVGSYDPNDKKENNGGIITPQQVSAGEPLTYLVRFQNTGTDTAFTVVIRDTLSNKVLPASLRIVNASHPYNFEIKNDNQLTWTFNDINLVDSNKNEPLSHGFVAYQINPLPSLSVGDTVKNSASIYFDYNLPVITNTEITILKNLLALPVKLGYFKAVRTNDGVDFLWRVVQQSKFSHFEVEKSFNGSSFSRLARLNAGGPEVTNSFIDYRYNDKEPLQSNNYYRLKMIDIDGSVEYSHVVLVHAGEDKTLIFSVYPNPANKQIKVDLDGDINGHLGIRIIDQLGRIQKTIDIGNQHTKSITMPVSIDYLAPGTYFLQLKLDQKNFTKKIVIK